jgi:hypothetical protein
VCFTSPPLPKRKKEVIEVMTEVRVVPLQPEKKEAVAAAEKKYFPSSPSSPSPFC